MRTLKHIFTTLLWATIGLYLLFVVLLHIPAIQSFVGSHISVALEKRLGTSVSIGRVDLGLLNRIIIDDVHVNDQQHQKMLEAARLSVKIDILPLFEGKIRISSAQLFGLHARLYKTTADAKPNFQFVIDSLASRDTTTHTPLDLRIQSLVIRNGAASWDVGSKVRRKKTFDTNHLSLTSISGHILLPTLTDDSLSLEVKKLAFDEQSGLIVRKLAFDAKASKKHILIRDFILQLPQSELNVGNTDIYLSKNNQLNSIRTILNPSYTTPSDLSCFVPELHTRKDKIHLSGEAALYENKIDVKKFKAYSDNHEFLLVADAAINGFRSVPTWNTHISQLHISKNGIQFIAKNLEGRNINIPQEITRLGNVTYRGHVKGFRNQIASYGTIQTQAGNAKFSIAINGKSLKTVVDTKGIDIGRITDDDKFGHIAANILASGHLTNQGKLPFNNLLVKGDVQRLDYNGYSYRNIHLDGTYNDEAYNGIFSIKDPHGELELKGKAIIQGKELNLIADASMRHFNPKALQITDKLGNTMLDLTMHANLNGSNINDLSGVVDVQGFQMRGDKGNYNLSRLSLKTGHDGQLKFLNVESDVANAYIQGRYTYESLAQSIANIIGHRLPSLPGMPHEKKSAHNAFNINLMVSNSRWLEHVFQLPIAFDKPIRLSGNVNEDQHFMNVDIDIPSFRQGKTLFSNGHLKLYTPNDTLHVTMTANKLNNNSAPFTINVNARANNDKILSNIQWDNNSASTFRGQFNSNTMLSQHRGNTALHIQVLPSELHIEKTKWNVEPSDIYYNHNLLNIDHFQMANEDQHFIVNGQTSGNPEDSLLVDFRNIDIEYILNLVKFHSVKFSGIATGKGYVKSFFTKPIAKAHLDVDNFQFENGQMGTLHADVHYDDKDGKINIDALADDGPEAKTVIKGYVSPKDNYIDLPIYAQGTRLEFIESFCGFMRDVDCHGYGWTKIVGDLGHINLVGELSASGTLGIKPLGTTYTLRDDSIIMIPNSIQFPNDTIYDHNGNYGILTGALNHENLRHLTADLNIEAHNLLSYDLKGYEDGSTFFGTIFATGNCAISNRPGRTNIDVNATTEKGSFIEYNADATGGVGDNSFIHWRDMTPSANDTTSFSDAIHYAISRLKGPESLEIPSDMFININGNTTPDFTLRVLMDKQTGDNISLNGNGMLHATYFNKGGFQMFGNYNINQGHYRLTIQNIIQKNFEFIQGSSIVFGGNPLHAALNLNGVYTVNSASLSDLQLGNSFSRNNVRVNCHMNITGTPEKPQVDFDIDFPTLGNDAEQMVRSVLNSEEEMKQQVIYLLAIGRFYNPGSNNAVAEGVAQQSQTSLAMQSFLSGTISQQINNVLSNVVKNTNWNFGANISTGNEGWNNAEYEGLLSGRMLNNRLLFNGQFGYRDNVTTNKSSFIGDFDLQYLIFPSGNLAVRFYNQTNDRYFTRNSLTTQGIGLIMKKDFTNLRDLFGLRKKKKTSKKGDK